MSDPTIDVLVPVDGDQPSENALEYALKEFPNAEITALHVVGIVETAERAERLSGDLKERYERAKATAEELFEGVERRGAEAGVEIGTELAFGPPSRAICERAADGFDRIVMGEHGQAGARQILLGSVAETVVRRAPVPVTVVRDGDLERRDRTFLVPVDGSPLSEYAFEYVRSEHAPEAITLLSVIDPTDPEPDAAGEDASPGPPLGTEEWYQRARERAAARLRRARESASGDGVSIDTEVETGAPARVIVRRAEELGVDHVAMGSHGRTGLDRLLLGSVAEAVVRRSPVTVTVVRR